MAKITNIKPQVRNKERVSVYLDGKYSFSLSIWQLESSKLKIGQELSTHQMESFQQDSDFGKFYDKTLMWLLLRPRSTWEVEDYLYRKTKDEHLRNEILVKIKKSGYLDDQDFAERWVSNRRLLKPMSKLKLRQELMKKRVPMEIIDSTLNEDETNEIEIIKALIEKKRQITRYQDDKKLMAYLSRQGFGYSDIKQALEEKDTEMTSPE